ncbi:UDP-N-acetylmuramate dehydrogenase [Prochlorococcus sp. MIT 1341]|uniref:UDP-N-acetylmuramate dehydrogenase n=1 Tax=Prochlorococcus sp. MIT 1341 TaxID=3096221 RepID=UPI002A752754|nr:UDP-N-acetylmuramate dehydrogenase [Prochlorococcus sp. MIT 1341]
MKLDKLVSLSTFTTWKVGGPAEFLAEATNQNEIKSLLQFAHQEKMPYQIIGAGSNLLINDSGLEGLTICTRKLQGSEINNIDGYVEAVAGESLPTLARKVAKAGLHGLEWSIGIPGTVGGATAMNAGAQGGCIAERLDSALVMALDSKKAFRIYNKELDFGYRSSRIQKEQMIVLSARFQLEPGHNQRVIEKHNNENLHHRLETQPYQLPSCGSVFRNPEPLKAGQLIENLGLKGKRIGDAEISKKHANFIVNNGNAKAHDIDTLIRLIQKEVKEAHQLLLHPEVKRLGF